MLGLGCFNSTATDVTLKPSTQIATTGENFTVDVFITPDTAVAGLQFDLEFDSSKIQVDSVSEGRLLNQNGASTFFNDGNIDNNAGILSSVYGSLMGSSSILEPASFASITMSVKEQVAGTSIIGLKNVIISDPSGKPIDAYIKNTTLTITEAPSETEVFYDSFEVGEWNGLWVEDSQNDWSRRTQRATDGRYSAEVDGRANDATLTSKDINLQDKTNAKITFSWLIERRLDSGEYLAFEVNDGSGWEEKAILRGNVDTEDIWHHETVELSGISSLQLRFKGKMSRSNEDANVDMIRVVAH